LPKPRVVDPSFWDDPEVCQLSRDERLLLLGLMTLLAEDYGRLLADAGYMRKRIFGDDDDMGRAAVRVMRDNILRKCRNLRLYAVDSQEYVAFLNWGKYQKIRYRVASKLPPYQDGLEVNVNTTTSPICGKLPESSENSPCVGLGSVGLSSKPPCAANGAAPVAADQIPTETAEPEVLFPDPEPEKTVTDRWLDVQHDQQFYPSYWRRINKAASRVAFRKRVRSLVREGMTPDEAVEFLCQQARQDRERFEPTPDWEWRSRLHPSTWLNGKRWEDEAKQVTPPAQRQPMVKL
jgi:hypothetical protein